MSILVKRAQVWKIDTPNTPGTLASTLSPLAESKVDLDLVMGYSTHDRTAATVEVFPVDNPRAQRAARSVGFRKSEIPCVTVTGRNEPGLARRITSALAEVGINLNFFIAQTVDSRFAGIFGFEAQSEADLAVKILRKSLRNGPTVARKKALPRTGLRKRSRVAG
jgi:hypothetical protein